MKINVWSVCRKLGMIVKIKHLKIVIAFLLGNIFCQLLFHFRFNNDLLRREMLILMSENNSGYFLSFIVSDIILILLLCLWIFIIYDDNKIRGIKNE